VRVLEPPPRWTGATVRASKDPQTWTIVLAARRDASGSQRSVFEIVVVIEGRAGARRLRRRRTLQELRGVALARLARFARRTLGRIAAEPGFGQSDMPPPSQYAYTFDHLAETANALLEQLKINRYSLYLQDYGGPVGFRIMVAHPDRVQALVIQNANAYEEGLGPKWKDIKAYWADPKAHPEVPKAFTSLAAAKFRHDGNSPHPERYNPELWTDEYAILLRPGENMRTS